MKYTAMLKIFLNYSARIVPRGLQVMTGQSRQEFAQFRYMNFVLTLYSAFFVCAGKVPCFLINIYYFIIPGSVFDLIF